MRKFFIWPAIVFVIAVIALLFFREGVDIGPPRGDRAVNDSREGLKIAPKPKKYFIQVANCFYESCKEMYMNLLRKEKQSVVQELSSEAHDVYKLISRESHNFEGLNRIIDKIDDKYGAFDISFIKRGEDAYKIYIGEFETLSKAGIYKARLEKLFPQKNFTLEPAIYRKEHMVSKILAGPYDTREKAKKALEILRSKRKFRGAFLIRF